jgi:hypothetical protein
MLQINSWESLDQLEEKLRAHVNFYGEWTNYAQGFDTKIGKVQLDKEFRL